MGACRPNAHIDVSSLGNEWDSAQGKGEVCLNSAAHRPVERFHRALHRATILLL